MSIISWKGRPFKAIASTGGFTVSGWIKANAAIREGLRMGRKKW